MQDAIQRTTIVSATKETIYDAIAHPDRVSRRSHRTSLPGVTTRTPKDGTQ